MIQFAHILPEIYFYHSFQGMISWFYLAEEIFVNWKLNVQSFILWIWMAEFWIWFIWKLAKNPKILFVEVFLSKPSTSRSNRSPDLSINNTDWLGWDNTQNSEISFNFSIEICCKHNASLNPVSFHYFGAFYGVFIASCSQDI